jgi:hypothetical protein
VPVPVPEYQRHTEKGMGTGNKKHIAKPLL